jgi:hypothetical protein
MFDKIKYANSNVGKGTLINLLTQLVQGGKLPKDSAQRIFSLLSARKDSAYGKVTNSQFIGILFFFNN